MRHNLLKTGVAALAVMATSQVAFAGASTYVGEQNFVNVNSSSPNYHDQQFFDNATNQGGGAAGTDAIFGRISSFTYNGNGQVTGFQITATITNDLPGSGTWTSANAHNESLTWTAGRPQNMHHVVLSTLFADDGIQGNFNVGGANVGPESNIYAIDYNKLGWYSYPSTGAYQVPTWDFGNILLGQSVTRVLDFGLYNAVDVSFFDTLYDWQNPSNIIDVFTSKTSNLKMGSYFSPLAADNGNYTQQSDVAVFFTPEPGMLALLAPALLGFGLSRRRRV